MEDYIIEIFNNEVVVYHNNSVKFETFVLEEAFDFIKKHHLSLSKKPLEIGKIVKLNYHPYSKFKILAFEYDKRRKMYCYFLKNMETGEPISRFENDIEALDLII